MPLRTISIVLSIALVATLLFGGLLHSIVPHAHSHSHGEISEAWELLHGSLRHEDKKTLAIIALIFIAVLSFAAAAHVFAIAARPSRLAPVRAEDDPSKDPMGEPLRKGIVSYRRFG